MRYETARELVETILDQLDEKRESPEGREDRRERDAVKYHGVRTAAGKRHSAKIDAQFGADAAKRAAIQKKIDLQHKKGEKAGTTNPHRSQQPELGGIRGVGHGDEGMRRVGVQSLEAKRKYYDNLLGGSRYRGVAKSNQKRRDALSEWAQLDEDLLNLVEALCEELDIDVETLLEDMFDAEGKKASQRSLGKLADRATLDADSRHVSNKDANASMRKYGKAATRAEKRKASKTIYTAKGGRVVKKIR